MNMQSLVPQLGGYRPKLAHMAIAAPIILSYIAFPNRKLAPLHALRLFALRVLLRYKGFLKSPNSLTTKLFMIAVNALTTAPDTTAFQPALPRLPVPDMDHTLKAFLKSVQPLLTPEELAQTERELQDFKKGPGRKLHRILQLMRWNPMSDSWLAEMWLRVAYLMAREPLPLASNYYGVDNMPYLVAPPTSNQAERAATQTYMMLEARQHIRNKTFPVLMMGPVPLCMDSVDKMFGTVRIPCKGEDKLEFFGESRHIIVACKGRVYTMEVLRSNGKHLTRGQLQQQFQAILDQQPADGVITPPSPPHGVRDVSLLQTLERDEWAEKRQRIVEGSELNRQSVNAIDTALFFIALDGPAPADMSGYVQALMHNYGIDRFPDKSFGLVIFANGLAGLHAEHSWCDGTVCGNVWDWMLRNESLCYESSYARIAVLAARAGKTPPRSLVSSLRKEDEQFAAEPVPTPKLLEWDPLDGEVPRWIDEARVGMHEQIAKVQNRLRVFPGVGKNCMKKCKVSPDAFVQFALQLAFLRTRGYLPLTYESVSMRLYRKGRTETNRSTSPESAELMRALGMEKNFNRTAEEKANIIKLFKTAADAHQKRIRTAMAGDGVDRHLIGLRVVAKATGTETGPVFEGPAFKLEWNLSTTTAPLNYEPEYSYVWTDLETSHCNVGGGFTQFVSGGIGAAYFFFDDATVLQCNVRDGADFKGEPVHQVALSFEEAFNDALQEFKAIFS